MSSDQPTVPDGFAQADPAGPDREGDVPTVNGDEPLPAGATLHGVVLDVTEGETESGDWYRIRIKDKERGVVDYFAKGDVKAAARRDQIEIGEEMWLAKGTEERSFEGREGTVTYLPTSVAFPEE